jgi:hypothetical protein
MRKPMTVRPSFQMYGLLVAVATLLSACSADTSIAPPAGNQILLPASAALASKGGKNNPLEGVPDGIYTVTIDPTTSQFVPLGQNVLVIPADGVCDLLTSGYGPATWNQPCAPQKTPVTLTVTLTGSSSSNPKIDFQPALRFNPTKRVELYISTKANKKTALKWTMLYCADKVANEGGNKCIDESITDSDLETFFDPSTKYVWRRIKHFSGYVIAGRDGNEGSDSIENAQ